MRRNEKTCAFRTPELQRTAFVLRWPVVQARGGARLAAGVGARAGQGALGRDARGAGPRRAVSAAGGQLRLRGRHRGSVHHHAVCGGWRCKKRLQRSNKQASQTSCCTARRTLQIPKERHRAVSEATLRWGAARKAMRWGAEQSHAALRILAAELP